MSYVICIIVKKRSPLISLGRPQKYRWTAVNWNNRRKLATSGEAFTNGADALRNAVQLFADATADPELLRQAKMEPDWSPSIVYLIQDGISGMQALRLKPA